MKNDRGLKLNLDIAYVSIFKVDVKIIAPGDDNEYVTVVHMTLPLPPNQIKPGDYKIEYNNQNIEIRLSVATRPEEDPLLQLGKNIQIGDLNLPFHIFTDNRGIYPCIQATLVFPYRLASWSDASHQSGMQMNYNYEEIQISGPPIVADKVTCLVVLNRLLKSQILDEGDYKPLIYENVTVGSTTINRGASRNSFLCTISGGSGARKP